jgi:hypothetical protein
MNRWQGTAPQKRPDPPIAQDQGIEFLGDLMARGHDQMKAMRPTRLTTKFCMSAALGLALAGVLAIPAPARAGDDDVPLDTQIFRNIMSSLGLQSADAPGIEYQERPPLVIPPNRNLPPPQKTDAALNNPAWPKDPDVARAKLQKQLERKGTSSEDVRQESNPLSPAELAPGAKYAPRTRRHQTAVDAAGADGALMTPSQLGFSGGLFKKMFGKDDKEDAKFTGEPPRTTLTEPPPGYQTPSPDQPYGTGKAAPPKADNSYVTRGEYKSD